MFSHLRVPVIRTRALRRTAVLWLPLALAAGACNCDKGTELLSNGVTLVTPAGKTDQFTRSINFGPVRVSDVATYQIQLHNNARAPVNITAGFASPTDRFFLKMQEGDSPAKATIPAASDYDIQLRYQPDKVGTDTTTVLITTTASSTPKYTINVNGQGAESQIDVCSTDDSGNPICFSTAPGNKLVIDMGSVVPGKTSTRPLIIKDLGALNLSVSSVAPTSTTSTEFGVAPPFHGPVTVDSGKQTNTYSVTYAPLFGGPEEGVIEIDSDDPVNPTVLVYLTGTGDAPRLCASPSSIEFGPISVGAVGSQTLTLTSCGEEPVILTDVSSIDVSPVDAMGQTPLYAVASIVSSAATPAPVTLPVTLAPQDFVTVNLTFTPIALGDATGHVNLVTMNANDGYIPMDGQGVGCALIASPNPVNFGPVPSGAAPTQEVVVTNDGTSPCTITNEQTSGSPYSVTNPLTASVTITPGQATIVDVTFTSSSASSTVIDGTLTVSSNATGGDLVVNLEGAGAPAQPCNLLASPASITFTGVATGQTASQISTVTNYGTDICDIIATVINPVNNGPTGDFTATLQGAAVTGPPGIAPVSLNPGQSVQVNVAFKPSTSNDENVNVQLDYCDDNNEFCGAQIVTGPIAGQYTPLVIPVTAGVLQPKVCLSPPSLNFGTVGAGQTKDLSFEIQSCGVAGSILNLNGLLRDSGTSPAFTIASTLPIPELIPAGSSVSVDIHYAPTTTNGDFGEIAVLSNDPNTPKALVPLQGNAANVCSTELVCSPSKLIFPTQEIGRAASLSANCLDVGTQPVTISSVSLAQGSSAAFTAGVGQTPLTVQPGGAVRVVVNYTPQEAGTDTGTLVVSSNSCTPSTVSLQGAGKVPNYPPCLPPQTFQPETKWYWTGGSFGAGAANVAMSPLVANLTDTNGDGLINSNDIPDVVFTACTTANCCVNCLNPADFADTDFSGIGTMHAVHGDTGADLFDVTAANQQLTAVAQLATADLDGDNLPEIVAVQHSFHPGTGMSDLAGKYISGVLLVFDHTGHLEFETQQWTGDPNNFEFGSAPAIADLDGDGKPEIVFERTVFNYDGTIKYNMSASGAWGHGSFPTIADVNGDGKPDIVSGAYVYEGDNGTLLWKAPGSGQSCDPTSITACATSGDMCDPLSNTCIMPSGPTMVLGFKLNGASTNTPVVVLRDGSESLHLLNGKTGAIIAAATWPAPGADSNDPTESDNGICPAAMSAADLDGDGQPEIIVPSGDYLYTFKYTGSSTLEQMWKYPINDYQGQCGASGSAAFDFNGVGKYDVVYHDTQYIYVLNGPDGSLMYQAPRSSDTIFETPVIADIDNDGHADLLMTNDENDEIMTGDAAAGVKALSNQGNTWPATRRIWSDHAYHETEITDGDTVPILEQQVWNTSTTPPGNNNWRAQNTLCTPSN